MECDKGTKLALAIKSGDERALEVFFRMEYNNLVHFITSYITDGLAAEDIVQDTFITLWNKRFLIDEQQNLRSYTYKIARNKMLNYLRDDKYRRNCVNADLEQLNLTALSDDYVLERIDALSLEELINKTYLQLPEDVRSTFKLNREFGMTYSQIAERQQVPVKAVEYKIHKALHFLRKKLRTDFLGKDPQIGV